MSSHTSSQLGLSGDNLLQTRMCKGLGADREEYDLSFPLMSVQHSLCWLGGGAEQKMHPWSCFPLGEKMPISTIPCFTAFVQLIGPRGCSVQPMLYTHVCSLSMPRHQVIPLTVIIVNKSFNLWLPGKNWTCVALLDKKCCKQAAENSI